MIKKILLVACSVGLLTAGVWAGLFKNRTDAADLSEVSEAGRETLRDTGFAFFTSQVRLDVARSAERKQRDAASKAQRLRADWERGAGNVDLAEAG